MKIFEYLSFGPRHHVASNLIYNSRATTIIQLLK